MRLQAFNNEAYEVKQYDNTLQTYEKASVKIATSLAVLNSGQNFIFSTALTMMMFLAAQGVVKGGHLFRTTSSSADSSRPSVRSAGCDFNRIHDSS